MTNGHVESGQVEKIGICQQPLQLIAQPLDDHGKPWGCGGCFVSLPSYPEEFAVSPIIICETCNLHKIGM